MKTKTIFNLLFLSLANLLLAQQYTVQEAYPGYTPINENPISFYFPDIFCSDGNTISCSNPNNLNLIGVGVTGCPNLNTDTLYKYVCISSSNNQNNCDLSNPYDWSWERVYFPFNLCKEDYCSYNIDHYAEPCYLKANNKQFIFYTHPNGDHQSRGRIAFRYSTDGQNWSTDYTLSKIADENIKDCSCKGGPTRTTAIYKAPYFYIYFEVLRNKLQDISGQSCCPTETGIGRQEQFLIRVLHSLTAPFINLEDGKAEVYQWHTPKWIPMDYDEGHNQLPQWGGLELNTGYIFGWDISKENPKSYGANCPSQYGYTYPNGDKIYFELDSIFSREAANDSLGDITLKSSGDGCVAIFSSFESNNEFDREILTRESPDCINFLEPYPLLNWELLGLNKDQLAHTGPSLFPWTSVSIHRRYLMAYANVPIENSLVRWDKAKVQLVLISKNIVPPPLPAPTPIRFIKLRLKDNLSFYDSNNNGILDNPIALPIDSPYGTIINSLQPLAYEEEGNYRVKAYYAYCYYKNKKKIKCVEADDADLPGVGLDEDQNVIYFKKGFFEPSDELDLQLILRAYDENKPKDKQKKCKKDDTCINFKIKFEQ